MLLGCGDREEIEPPLRRPVDDLKRAVEVLHQSGAALDPVDLLLPLLWVGALLGNDFVWRGNPMRATDVPSQRRGRLAPRGARIFGRARSR